MDTWLNKYLVLQGHHIPFRTSQFEQILKLLARQTLGTRWAKYPFSRCRLTRIAREGSAGGLVQGHAVALVPEAVHLMRSTSNARNAISSQSFSFQRKCLLGSARESL